MNTTTRTQTITITNARDVAAKIAADLKRMQRLAGQGCPTDSQIDNYEVEMILLLKEGFLEKVTYGFKQNDQWIMAVQYHATSSDGKLDNDPGGIRADRIGDAVFGSFLIYSKKWSDLSSAEKDKFREKLPFRREGGNEPNGDWSDDYDNTYKSGGIAVQRRTLL